MKHKDIIYVDGNEFPKPYSVFKIGEEVNLALLDNGDDDRELFTAIITDIRAGTNGIVIIEYKEK